MGSFTTQFHAGGLTDAPRSGAAVRIQPMPVELLTQFASGGYLYALLDATGAPAVQQKARELGEQRAISMYQGTTYSEYSAIAPYLFRVDPALLLWIRDQFPVEPWGIFLVSKESFEAIFENCRRHLVVTLADRKQWLFRYYDPRVLEKHLLRASKEELTLFFGPVRSFVTVTGNGLEAKAFFAA